MSLNSKLLPNCLTKTGGMRESKKKYHQNHCVRTHSSLPAEKCSSRRALQPNTVFAKGAENLRSTLDFSSLIPQLLYLKTVPISWHCG